MAKQFYKQWPERLLDEIVDEFLVTINPSCSKEEKRSE